jgi:hypothetical protein
MPAGEWMSEVGIFRKLSLFEWRNEPAFGLSILIVNGYADVMS